MIRIQFQRAFLALIFIVGPVAAPAFAKISSAQVAIDPAKNSCCKVCTKGYACGNTCISRKKTCHKPPGCACNRK
jgi:hypothetical protein